MKPLRSFKIIFSVIASMNLSSCSKDSSADGVVDPNATVIKVDATKFLTCGLSESISIVSRTLSNGTTVDYFKIVSKSTPTTL
jgi:hypothetical protein